MVVADSMNSITADSDVHFLGLARDALKTFEWQVLVFPLLVVLLACASFLFGGRCAAWQWWTAVAAVVAVPFARKERIRAALGSAGLFRCYSSCCGS